MKFVKLSSWFTPVARVLLRWRIRRELKRLKAIHAKLRQAVLQAEQMKTAITNWKAKH